MAYQTWIALKSASVGSRLLGNIAATQGPSRFPRLSHCRRRRLPIYEATMRSEARARRSPSDSLTGAYVPSLLCLLLRLLPVLFPLFDVFSYHAITSHIALPLALQRKVTKRNITLHRPITINYIHSHSHPRGRLTIVAYVQCRVY